MKGYVNYVSLEKTEQIWVKKIVTVDTLLKW